MSEDVFRKWHRREYLRQHAANRRADAKAEGARRIDVTLRGESLDNYASVRRWIEDLNRIMAERPARHPETGLRMNLRPIRLSDNEIIRFALSMAADQIEDEDKPAKAS